MAPKEGLTVAMVDLGQPFLYHQPALSFVFNGPFSTKRLPTQLVFPDGRVALGQVPTTISFTQDQLDDDMALEEDDEARIARLRQDTIVAYACVSEAQPFDQTLVLLSVLLLVCIAFQTMWIGVILSGGQIYPFAQNTSGSNADNSVDNNDTLVQRMIYINILLLHLLPLIGVLYRQPVALSIYNFMQFVNFVLLFTCCLQSALDVLVLISTIPVQILATRIERFMTSHVFALKKEQQLH